MTVRRSSLFVPGNKPDWIAKAVRSGADHLILDLEDSVPHSEKKSSRALVRAGLAEVASQAPSCSARINGFATGLVEDDLEGIVCRELEEVLLPKVETVADMQHLDALLAKMETRHGLPPGRIRTPLGMETASAMHDGYEIARSCPRVDLVFVAAGAGGDASRSVGYRWSKDGRETLYLRSKAVLDARAAGIDNPMISSWWDVADLDGLRRDAERNRSLGFRGQIVIHPSHVAVVNEVFTPSAAELSYYRGLIEAYEEGRRQGTAAVLYDGDMIDTAMVETAREILGLARRDATPG